MALYTQLDTSEIEKLAACFGIEDVIEFSAIHGGLENTSYCIESGSASASASEKYILTIWDQKSLAQATNLAKLLAYLTDQGIRTSQVVVPPKKPMVILFDEKPVMLKRYVEGQVIANLTDNLLIDLGAEIARLHKIPAPSYLPKTFPYGRSHFPEVIDSNLDHAFLNWLSEKNSYLNNNISQHLPVALIHGDIFFDNVIVQNDQLMAIIDFEEACHYYRGFDLGMIIVGACRDGKEISFKKAKRVIQGYEMETVVSLNERKTLKVFTVYAAVATSFWRFRQFHILRPDPQLRDKHVEMQALADTIYEYPDSYFTNLFNNKDRQEKC